MADYSDNSGSANVSDIWKKRHTAAHMMARAVLRHILLILLLVSAWLFILTGQTDAQAVEPQILTAGGRMDSDAYQLSFSPDGKTLASSGSTITGQDRLLLWDMRTRKVRRILMAPVDKMAFSPNGQQLATLERDYFGGHVLLWNTQTGRRERSIPFGREGKAPGNVYGPPISLAFSQRGDVLAVGTENEREAGDNGPNPPSWDRVLLWDVATGRLRRILGSLHSPHHTPAYSSDGATLAMTTASDIILCDSRTGRTRRILRNSEDVTLLIFSHDGRTLVAGGVFIKAYDVRTGRLLWQRRQKDDRAFYDIDAAAVSPDGKIVAYAGSQSSLSLCDDRTGRVLQTLPLPYEGTRSIAFSPNGQWLAAGCPDGVELWPMKQIIKVPHRRAVRQSAGLDAIERRR